MDKVTTAKEIESFIARTDAGDRTLMMYPREAQATVQMLYDVWKNTIPKAVTNADHIRQMDDDQLTKFLYDVNTNSTMITTCRDRCADCEKPDTECMEMYRKYLQQEHE